MEINQNNETIKSSEKENLVLNSYFKHWFSKALKMNLSSFLE